jgi:putative transport protein
MALTCLIVALVAASGLWLGSIKIGSFSLGIPGVMFTGLLLGRLMGKGSFNDQVIYFVRDFGLILFVYAVGVQVGPSFLATLRRNGLPLNLLAVAIVLLGAGMAVGISHFGKMDIRAAVGLFAGGTTNAPAYGSASEALKSVHPETMPALNGGTMVRGLSEASDVTLPAFAISYPFGLLGVILAMVILRIVFRAKPNLEAEELEKAELATRKELTTSNIELTNPNLNGLPLKDLPAIDRTGVIVSRVQHGNKVEVATAETPVYVGDVLLAVGEPEEVKDFQLIVGRKSLVDLRSLPSKISTRQVLVTHREVLGKNVNELRLAQKYGVTVTRVQRAGLEFTAVGNLKLQFGDRVRVVGEANGLAAAAKLLGDSSRELNHPRLLPIFIGIAIGVIFGSLPILPVSLTSLPAPVKLGLAAGPMIIAIILARIGRVGGLIWYMPQSASGLLRELGIVMFLIAVGINGGEGFFNKVATSEGGLYLALGAAITIVPLLLVGLFARLVMKVNYLHICGLLCGSMTSPSLAFTHTMTTSEAPAVAFATVYPLTMILRVLVAQILILAFVR